MSEGRRGATPQVPAWEVKRGPLVAGADGRNPYKTVKFRANLPDSRLSLFPHSLALLLSRFDCSVHSFSVDSQKTASAVSGPGWAAFLSKGPDSRYFQLCRSQLLSPAVAALREAAIGKMSECGCALIKRGL